MALTKQEFIHNVLVSHFMVQLSLVADAEPPLKQRGMGRIHHRVMFFARHVPGIKVSELLSVLDVRHQNIQPILRQLIQTGHIVTRHGREDRRIKHLYISRKGERALEAISAAQRERIGRAYDAEGPHDAKGYLDVMSALLGPEKWEWAKRLTQRPLNR